MRIFLSYGHDGYASLVSRIQRDLEALGHQVWFDVERLKPGGDWECYIEDGLNFVSAVPDAGRFLLLLTPHSARRPDGYCLNELARAFGRNLPVIPVMVSTVEPPLSICRLQWLDMRGCFPAEQHEEQYAKQFDQLVKALTEKQVPFEGVQQRLLNHLQPISYGDDLTRHLARFTGREWVMGEVKQWLASSRRVLWITGEAGVGKSALAAWLCAKLPEIAAYHFCRFGNSDRVDARTALFSVAYQLSTQLAVYQDRLNASALDQTAVETNVPKVFDRLFVNLLSNAVPLVDKSQVLLIDALDEATRNGRNELASLIGSELHRLPAWLRVIVTSRPHEQEINFTLQALDPWKIDAGRSENLDDVRKYLRFELRPFAGNDEPSEQIVDAIVEKSEGLFLYASWVRQEVQDGRLSLAGVEKFPRGLGGVYADFFKRYFPDAQQYASDCLPALEAICAAREPLERRDLALLLKWPEYKMRGLMVKLGSLFPLVDGRVRPFHQSIRDWLTDPARSGPYWIDISAQEQRLADLAWQEFKDGVNTMGPYCIKYAPSHLATCKRKDELRKLLLDPAWMQAKLQASDVVALLADYELALSAVAPDTSSVASRANDREADLLRLIQRSLMVSAQVLARDKSQLATQLLGRIPENEELRERVLKWSLTIQRPWLRPLTASLATERSIRWLRPAKTESLWRVVFSSNGRWAAHVSHSLALAPSNIVLWDLVAWESKGVSFRAVDPFALAVSNDGRWCLYADSTGGVHRVSLGAEVWEGRAQRDLSILDLLAISGDGKRALSACRREPLVAWDIDADCHEVIRDASDNNVAALILDARGESAVVTLKDGSVELFDLWPTHHRSGWRLDGAPVAIARSADNLVIVAATVDGRIEVRSAEFPESALGTFRTEEEPSSVAISADARYVAVGTQKGTVEVWDLAERSRKARYRRAHTHTVECITFSHNVGRIVSADSLQIKEWALEAPELEEPGFIDSAAQGQVKVTSDGQHAVAVLGNGGLGIWNLRTGRLESTLPHPDGISFGCGGFRSAEGIALAIEAPCVLAWNEELLCVWDLRAGTSVRSLLVKKARDAAITPDGEGVVFTDGDEIRFWSPAEGTSRQLGTCDPDTPYHVAISSDGKRALSTAGREVTLWRLDGPIQNAKDARVNRYFWRGTDDKPSAVAFIGPERAIIRSGTNSLFMFDVRKWTSTSFRLDDSDLAGSNRAAPLGEGRLFATSSYGGPITVWDLHGQRSMTVVTLHPGTVGRVSASAKRLLLSSLDGVLKVVSLVDQSLLVAFQGDKQIVTCDGDEGLQWVVGRDESGQMHFFCVESPSL